MLLHPELGLYQRAGQITKIHEDTFVRPDETETTVLVIDEAGKYELLLDVTGVASFDRHNENQIMVPADPTTLHINTLMGLRYRSRLRRLNGVIKSPLLLSSGRLIERYGYDEATCYFFDNGGVEFPPIPERPGKTECLAALKLLDDDLLSEFPFVDDASRSVALSALLTGIARPALMLAPMHAYSAPEAGTGKSYLADLVVLLATGRFAAAINAGKDEEELEKRKPRTEAQEYGAWMRSRDLSKPVQPAPPQDAEAREKADIDRYNNATAEERAQMIISAANRPGFVRPGRTNK